MGVRIEGVQAKRVAVAGERLGVPAEVVQDVAKVEVRLEHVGVERDRALVQCLGFRDLVARVVDVGEVDQRGHEVRIQLQRAPVAAHGLVIPLGISVVGIRRFEKRLLRGGHVSARKRVHERRERRRLGARELQHLRGAGIAAEVEGELAGPRRHETPEHRAEARTIRKARIHLPDHGHVGKEVMGLALQALRLDEAELLHVAEVILVNVPVPLEDLPSRDRSLTDGRHRVHYNPEMLLAGDIGGTKTLLGLFDPAARPIARETRSYHTGEFSSFGAIVDAFARDVGGTLTVDAACIGVAGPVVDGRAALTNVHWDISVDEIRRRCSTARVALINDLEAIAASVTVLTADEVVVLQEGRAHPTGNAAVIAAGTGLGQAFLVRVNDRFRTMASEGGHADFAARTDRELELVRMLRERYGRAEVEQVLSGPGVVNLFRFTHRGGECTVVTDADAADAPAQITRAALAGRCQFCADALRMFVEAYGAEAGNLGLRALATAGVFIGGGIAPKILPALRNGTFMTAFRAKVPLDDLVTAMPVKVIVNDDAGLLGAAVRAASLLATEPNE